MITDLVRYGMERLHSRTLTTPARWASQHIVVGNPFPGPLQYTHHPWMREMINAEAEVCVGQKAAQLGYSTLAVAVALYTVVEGRNVLYLLPTRVPDASDFSISRFDKIIDSSEYLTEMFAVNKNVGVKRATTGTIYIRGMNSNSALKSVDVSLLVFDEVDEMAQGKIPLAQQRLAGQLIKRSWYVSTPTIPDFGINALLKESTESHFFFPCPSCSRHVELLWPDAFELCGESHTDPDCARSHIKCPECTKKLPHETKAEWLAPAKFQPTRQSDALGFYINQLYSATRLPVELARAYFRAQIDIAAEQEFWNSMMGLARLLQGSRLEDEDLTKCYGNYRCSDPPPANRLITIGIDIGKLLHYWVDSWIYDQPCADINLASFSRTITAGTLDNFSEIKNLITQFSPAQIVIDSEPETRKALEMVAYYPGLINLCKFTRGDVDNTLTGDIIVKANRTAWLDTALSRFRTQRTTIPLDLPRDVFAHAKALVRRYRQTDTGDLASHYVSTGADHFMFARVYSEIAFPLAIARYHNRDLKELLP